MNRPAPLTPSNAADPRDGAGPRRVGHSGLGWLALVCLLGGCRSAAPPAPQPVILAQAERASELGAREARRGRWQPAADRWEQAVELYALLNQRGHEAVARHNLAQALRELNQPEAARAQLREAALANQTLGRSQPWWRNQIALIQLEQSLGETGALAAHIQELMPASKQIKDPETRALFLNEVGLWHLETGKAQQAEAFFGEAQIGFARAGDPSGCGTALANQGLALEEQNRFPAALERWQAAQTRFEEAGNPLGIATSLAGQGRVMLRQKTDLPGAEDLLRRAARNFQRLEASAALERTLILLKEALQAQGKRDDLELWPGR